MKNLKERLLKDNQKTQMVLKEFSVRPEWSSIHTNSDKRNNVYYERRTQYWNKHIFWRDWPCTCPLGYLLFIQKLKEKWIQFLNVLFLIQPGKRWTCYKAAWKPREALENSLYTCFKCESNKIFSIAKQVRSGDEWMTVFNKCRGCHSKWRDWLCDKCPAEICMLRVPN